MTNQPLDEEAIFLAALEKQSQQERNAFVAEACADRPDLLERVRELLGSHDESLGPLDAPIANINATLDQPVTEKPGAQIGPYKLLQKIGEGGFGVVYMAEQTKPVRRKVALKIIKPGMDTKEVIARFEAERQALALMDHPNIARVLDAGATEAGRPYFVMELVRGVPLTEYADRNHLPARQRLELFVEVCHAIQHAHQKGVIHRDLKPSNIMVTLHDGKPVPKVIDFGVSKALSQQLTEKTLFTAYGQMVGTPTYMSPEQAEMSGLDIDTRSDVYSLGVLLYELLTGSTPFDAKRLLSAGYAEMQRIIREEEPVKPSTRLTTLGEESTVVSRNRGTDPRKLGQLVRGDLDWIVMKALDKERNRRYETATGFAADIERFLADEPVEACPPSAAYRFRKFARRNKGPMALTAAALLALIAVAIGSTIAADRFRNLAQQNADLVEQKQVALTTAVEAEGVALAAQKQAEEARDHERELRQEAQRQRERAKANFALARSAVDEFLNRVTENELLTVPGMQPLRQELLSSAMEFYDDFTRDEANADELLAEVARAHYRLAVIYDELGQSDEAAASTERSIELFEQLRDGGNDSTDVRLGLAKSYFRAGRHDETVTLCRDILDAHPENAENRRLLANTYNVLAISDKNNGDIAQALAYHQQALPLRQGLVDEFPDNPVYLAELGSIFNNLGVIHAQQRKRWRALELFKMGVRYDLEAYRRSPQTIRWGRWLCTGLRNLANHQPSFGEHVKALENYELVVEIRRGLMFDNPRVPSLKAELHRALRDLGNYQRELNRFEEANRSFKEAKDILEIVHRKSEAPDELFELAIIYGALATPPEGTADPPDEDELAEQQHYADLAVETLQQAVANGYRNVRALKSDEYLAALRERDDFTQLVDHLDKLRRAEELAASEGGTPTETLTVRRQEVNVLRDLIHINPAGVSSRRRLATALNSIGEIQIELEQFPEAEQSLQQALELRKELCEQNPQDPELQLELLSTRIRLGELDWTRGELSAAHTRWQQYLAESAELLAAFPDSRVVQEGRLAAEERAIYRRYGRLALWPLLLEFADRTVRYDRAHLFHIGDQRFTQAVLAANDPEETERLLRCLGTDLQDADLSTGTAKWNYAALIRTAAIADVQILPPDEMVSIALRIFDDHRTAAGCAMALAVAQYRAGEYAQALETARPAQQTYLAFFEAAITERLGDHAGALKLWADAQTRYQSLCADILAESVPPQDGTMRLTGWREQWWHFATMQALRREAYRVIYGEEPDDPWQHLIQARGYRLIGETEQSEAELAAAAAAAGNDPKVWIARAELFERWADFRRAEADWQQVVGLAGNDPAIRIQRAEWYSKQGKARQADADWQRAVELAGDDPMIWIRRGRWYAQQGEREKAEADFAQAASLTPNELNKFLEAGWWMIGPYPADVAEFCPPELDPDPSRPVRTIDPESGLSDEPQAWVDAPTRKHGVIDLSNVSSGGKGRSVYAVANVYSPTHCSRLARVGGWKAIRIWCNGRLVYESNNAHKYYSDHLCHRVPLALRQGMNRILVKVVPGADSPTQSLHFNLGDAPIDRFLTMAEAGIWQKAAGIAFHQMGEQLHDPFYAPEWTSTVQIALLTGDHRVLERGDGDRLLNMALTSTNTWDATRAANALAATDNAILREHSDEIDRVLQTREIDAVQKGVVLRTQADIAAHLGRTTDFEEILSRKDRPDPRYLFPLRAIVQQHLGNDDRAQTLLEQSFDEASQFPKGSYWPNRARYLARVREAERVIRGGSNQTDEFLATAVGDALANWQNQAPDTAAYDHLVQTWGAIGGDEPGGQPFPFLARGRRLAELGRLEEAEADFNKALELAPDDVEVLMARAEFYEQCGDVGRAWEEFRTALRKAKEVNPVKLLPLVERQLALHEAVLDEGLRRDSDDEWLLRIRAERQLTQGNWTDAVENLRAGWTTTESSLAPLYCLLGDDAGYRQSCERLDELIAGGNNPVWRPLFLGLQPPTEETARRLSTILETELADPRRDRFQNYAAGLALYRTGRYDEALTMLTESLEPARCWQHAVMIWPLLAMTEWRLGHHDQARKWLKRTAWWSDLSERAVDVPHAFCPPGINYWRWLDAQVFYREAQSLIDGDAVASPPDKDLAAPPEPESQASEPDESNPGGP